MHTISLLLALVATSLEKFAVEMQFTKQKHVKLKKHLQKVKRVIDYAHKRNPIGSENITGISRVIRGYITTAYENVPLWHERDISHSLNVSCYRCYNCFRLCFK